MQRAQELRLCRREQLMILAEKNEQQEASEVEYIHSSNRPNVIDNRKAQQQQLKISAMVLLYDRYLEHIPDNCRILLLEQKKFIHRVKNLTFKQLWSRNV